MSYQVFARKYRPQKFEDIVAQDHVTRTLRNAVANGRVASGYLFCGPRGTGKTTTARVLAKALNCEQGPTPDPCGECSHCREIASGSSLDVLEIDAASNTGVDDIRTLRENVRYLPSSGNKRIYIIDEVHRLSTAAFDALLKTLEEPPPHVVFMMATTEPIKVPDTILSRTQRFDLKRVSAVELSAHLKSIADQEGLTVSEAALSLLARKADGSVRDALSLLDQIAAFEGDKIDEQTVVQALGLVDRELLLDFCRAIAAGDSPGVLGICKKVTDGGTDPDDFVAELLEQFRLLMIVAGAGQAPETSGLTDDELSIYQKLSKSLGVGDILRLIKIAGDLNLDLKTGLDPRLLLEVAAVRMAELERTVALQEVIDRMGTTRPSAPLQKKKPEAAPPAAVTTLRRPPEPTDRANEAPPSWPRREVSLETVRSGWEKFLGELGHRRSMLASQLAMAEVRSVEGRTVVAAFGTSGHAALQVLQKPTNLSLISEALCRHFESDLNLHLTQIEDAQPTARRKRPGRRRVDPTQLLAKSARLRELVEKVDGEIIGVRRAAD